MLAWLVGVLAMVVGEREAAMAMLAAMLAAVDMVEEGEVAAEAAAELVVEVGWAEEAAVMAGG